MRQLLLQTRRQAKRTRRADLVGQLRRDHVLVNPGGRRLRRELRLKQRLLRVRQNVSQQHRFKLPAHLADFFRLRNLQSRHARSRRHRVHARADGA